MPRYYFDTYDGRDEVKDEDGMDFPDRASARREAAAALADMAHDALPDGQRHEFRVKIRDNGVPWFEARLHYQGRYIERPRTGVSTPTESL